MVYEAGLVSFLRTILIIVGVYLLFKLFFRFLVPFLLKLFINKQKRKYSDHFNNHGSVNHKEGDVSIKNKSSHQKSSEDLGEYVEYEDLDDQEK
jgi:hypothetical protein